MWLLSDESLLAGFGSGDREASAAFVRRFQGRVFGLTLSILRDAGAAEDAAQETFVRAWRHAGAYDPRRGSVPTWLLTIARNASLNMLPTRRADPMDPGLLLALEVDRPASGADAESIARSLVVRDALKDLPPAQRRALVLSAFYGLTARDVSELDGVPLGTVKNRIRAGMTKLRAQLGVADEP